MLAPAGTFAQDHKKKGSAGSWTSPDGLISLDVPIELKEDSTFSTGDSDPDGYERIQGYGGINGGDGYVVIILTLSKNLQKKSRNDKFGGLEFVIGGDDDDDFTSSDSKTGRFPSREIIYRKQSSRGLFINTGRYIVVLGLRAEHRENLDTATANRFFKSFQLNGRK